MPGLNTIKTLEERQTYLMQKVQSNLEKNHDQNTHFLNEIRALEQSMNFIKWMINNASNDIVQGAIEKYKGEDKHDEESADEDIEKEKGIFKGILCEKYSYKRKLEITITEYRAENYIFLEEMRLKQDKLTWKKTAKIRMTLHKLEKILKRVYETLGSGNAAVSAAKL